jgi:aspartyl protease family protein
MNKFIIISILCFFSICSFGQVKPQNNNSKDDVKFSEKKGWSIIQILNTTFSATFVDDFKSKENSENWDLLNEPEGSSTIENERLNIKFNSEGRIRVPIAEAPMDLTKNNFDIISIFDKISSSLFQGVIFGYKDGKNYSSITFNPKMKMMVYEKYEDGILTGDDEKRDIYTKETFDNELRIKKENRTIAIYFNSVKTYEINEVAQPGNGVGVMAGGNETMNKAFVKYFSANILLPDELVFGIDKKVNIVKVKKSNGVYSVPVELNGVLKIDFIFDSGASDVSISPDVAMTLLRTGTIKKEDWLEGAYYKFADGSVAKSKRFKLSSIKVGNKIIRDVTCSISNSIDAPMLLGQSVLSRFGKYTFDNVNQKLIID